MYFQYLIISTKSDPELPLCVTHDMKGCYSRGTGQNTWISVNIQSSTMPSVWVNEYNCKRNQGNIKPMDNTISMFLIVWFVQNSNKCLCINFSVQASGYTL